MPSRKKRMPLGPIAAFLQGLLLLLARIPIRSDGRTHSSEAEIESAVISLLEFYDRYGQGKRRLHAYHGNGTLSGKSWICSVGEMIVDTIVQSGNHSWHITLMMLPIEYAESMSRALIDVAYRTKTYIAGTGRRPDLISKLHQWNDGDYWFVSSRTPRPLLARDTSPTAH